MNWRSEQGSSLPLMVASVWLALILLGACMDFGRYYIYRQQLKTAIDAATLAGALQARLRMNVLLLRTETYYVPVPAPCSKPGMCGTIQERRTRPANVPFEDVAEEIIWAPHKYRGYAHNKMGISWAPQQGVLRIDQVPAFSAPCAETNIVCNGVELTRCRVIDDLSLGAVAEASRRWETLKSRWDWGSLTNLQVTGPTLVNNHSGTYPDFRVNMSVRAEMPTQFLKMFGLRSIPMKAEIGAKWNRVGLPQGCV